MRIKGWLAGNAAAPRSAVKQPKSVPAQSEGDLELSSVRFIGGYRARNLAEIGIRTLADLEAVDEAVLGAVKGIGMGNAARIKASLASNGRATAAPVKKIPGKPGRPRKVIVVPDVQEDAVVVRPGRRKRVLEVASPVTARPSISAAAATPIAFTVPDNEPIAPVAPDRTNDVPTDIQLFVIAIAQLKNQMAEGLLSNRFNKQCDRISVILPDIEKSYASLSKKDRKNVTRALDALTDVAGASAGGKKLSAKRLDAMFEEVKSARKRLAGLSGN